MTVVGYLLCVSLAGLGFSIFMMDRNKRVFRWITTTLDQLGKMCEQDAMAGLPWKWRFDLLKAHGYDEMMFKFWKPIDSFHDMTMLAPYSERTRDELRTL